MIDVGLIARAKKAVESKERKHVTPAILCAFVMQESHGCPYFVDTKPGSIYRLNTNAAISYKATLKGRLLTPEECKERGLDPNDSPRMPGKIIKIDTGLIEAEIRAAITIPNKIGNFDVPAIMRGKLAKFRFEPGYWKKYKQLSKIDRFLYSSSWGLVQFMGPNISPQPDRAGIEFIKRFMADVDLQLLYGAGMIDDLLKRAGGDPHKAYRGYNSGNVNSTNQAVIKRADNVQKLLREIEAQIKNG